MSTTPPKIRAALPKRRPRALPPASPATTESAVTAKTKASGISIPLNGTPSIELAAPTASASMLVAMRSILPILVGTR